MPDGASLNVKFPAKLSPLFTAYRYKIIKGGRGKGGSWGVARALLIRGCQAETRVLCVREFQRSIADSVHQLLCDQIKLMGLEQFYRVTEAAIHGVNGTQFVFAGLRQLDAAKLMSFEGVDVCWVEQAENISKKSWEILIPTIRKPASEIWLNLNPQLDSDETYVRFIERTPPESVLIEMSYRDNPWFPEVLEKERIYCKQTDAEGYENIWEGKCRTSVEGAIYANEIRDAIEAKRIRPVPYDPMLKVHTVWDLGWNDSMAIIFVQRLLNQVMIIDYLEDRLKKYDWYVEEIKAKRYNLGRVFLPHDAGHESPLLTKNPEDTIRALGLDTAAPGKLEPVEAGIKRVRMLFPRLYIDDTRCTGLINHLRRYRRVIPTTTNEPGSPLHDEHSHGADALRLLAGSAEQMTNDQKDKPLPIPDTGIV